MISLYFLAQKNCTLYFSVPVELYTVFLVKTLAKNLVKNLAKNLVKIWPKIWGPGGGIFFFRVRYLTLKTTYKGLNEPIKPYEKKHID